MSRRPCQFLYGKLHTSKQPTIHQKRTARRTIGSGIANQSQTQKHKYGLNKLELTIGAHLCGVRVHSGPVPLFLPRPPSPFGLPDPALGTSVTMRPFVYCRASSGLCVRALGAANVCVCVYRIYVLCCVCVCLCPLRETDAIRSKPTPSHPKLCRTGHCVCVRARAQ